MAGWYAGPLKRADIALQMLRARAEASAARRGGTPGNRAALSPLESWAGSWSSASSEPQPRRIRRRRDRRSEAAEVVLRKQKDAARATGMLTDILAGDSTHPRALSSRRDLCDGRSLEGSRRAARVSIPCRAGREARVATLHGIVELHDDRLGSAEGADPLSKVVDPRPRHLPSLKGSKGSSPPRESAQAAREPRAQLALAATPRQKMGLLGDRRTSRRRVRRSGARSGGVRR